MNKPLPQKLPRQNDLKKVCKGAFAGGADEVRLEVAGMVIIAKKNGALDVVESPLENWRRSNGEN